MKKALKFFFFLIVLFIPQACQKPIDSKIRLYEPNKEENITEEFTIYIKYPSIQYIGIEKYIYLDTDFNDQESNIFDIEDIEESTLFNATLAQYKKPGYNSYNIICWLWKAVNKNLNIICKIKGEWNYLAHTARISGTSKIIYKNYNIKITPLTSYDEFNIYQASPAIPFLYSGEQIINIEENTESYELKFKIGEYNDELLFLSSGEFYIYLYKCERKENYLICIITKEEIEEELKDTNQKFNLYSYDDNHSFRKLAIVYNIIIIDNISKKQDIYI